MKVDCIKNNKQIYFTAGQVNLYSDFDGTYLPVSHTEMKDISNERKQYLQNYFDEFRPMLQEDDLHFTITTGRTFGEFQTVSDLIKSKGIQMPIPDTFIGKNGADEYTRVATDSEYYNQGKFPFAYGTVNTQKHEDLKSITGWNDSIKDKFREILKKHSLEIIECESENSGKDYGQGSLMTHVRYDEFELKDNMDANSEWKVGLRKDGKLKLYASFPYDMRHVGARSYVYDQIKEEFEKYLDENGVKFTKEEYRDKVGGKRPVLVYTPQMPDGSPLTKLYDTKKAVQDAIKNNDFVITAGDGKNDFEMLNPLNYIETSDLDSDLQKQLKNLNEENVSKILENPSIVERLKKLPFVGIIIKGKNNGLEHLAQHFEQFNRIIEVESGKMQDGIKQAVQKFAQENTEFAQNLSESLKIQLGMAKQTVQEEVKDVKEVTPKATEKVAEDVIEIVKHTTENASSETSKATKGKGGKIAAIGAAITAGLTSIYYFFFNKNHKNENPK